MLHWTVVEEDHTGRELTNDGNAPIHPGGLVRGPGPVRAARRAEGELGQAVLDLPSPLVGA
jgi:hypothetical protein